MEGRLSSKPLVNWMAITSTASSRLTSNISLSILPMAIMDSELADFCNEITNVTKSLPKLKQKEQSKNCISLTYQRFLLFAANTLLWACIISLIHHRGQQFLICYSFKLNWFTVTLMYLYLVFQQVLDTNVFTQNFQIAKLEVWKKIRQTEGRSALFSQDVNKLSRIFRLLWLWFWWIFSVEGLKIILFGYCISWRKMWEKESRRH